MKWAGLLCLVAAWPAFGAVRGVGAGAEYPTFAAALHVAQDGDTIHIGPGSYFECGIVTQHRLVLEGEGDTTILTDKPCEGKALLVVRGNGLTIRNLVLARVRVPDRNGAGIRLEGQGLTVERVRFDNNEVGLLAGQAGTGTIMVHDCVFVSGGVAGDRPTAAVMVGEVALLRIERSTFDHVKGGQVSTAAQATELVGNTISLGAEPGTAVPVTSSGHLLMTENTIEIGTAAPARGAVVLATGPGATLRRNTLRNRSSTPATLLLDWMSASPVLDANTLDPGDTEVSGSGVLRHRAGTLARGAVSEMRRIAGGAKQLVKGVIGR